MLLASCGLSNLTGSSLPAAAPPAEAGQQSLWQDATIFQAVTKTIGGAGQRVWVEMYEFDRPDLIALLIAAHRKGLDVRVITDPSVSVSRPTRDELVAAGVPARYYPIDTRIYQIDHVKLLLTESSALVAGMNWGTNSDRNHDYGLLSTDPTWISRLGVIFAQDWSLAGGNPDPRPDMGGPIGQTAPGEGIRSLLNRGIEGARTQIRCEVFVLTDQDLIARLAAAERRGVDVRILLDPNQSVNQAGYQELVGAGVGVRWYPIPRGALIHAKIGLFDSTLVLGSANWSKSGLSANHELDVETQQPALTGAYATRFEADWTVSAP
jgi:phosphatidylserine/phosphatidylglycerophosphate/cardiolipin synthase-like enzyme